MSIVFGLIWKALLVSSITTTILQKTEGKPGGFSLVGKKVYPSTAITKYEYPFANELKHIPKTVKLAF